MIIKLYSRGISPSGDLNKYAEAKIRLALGLFETRIRRAEIFLTDVNGPKGGEDKLCKIKVKVDGLSDILIHEKSSDIYDSINICTHRLKRVTLRNLDRIQNKSRRTVEL